MNNCTNTVSFTINGNASSFPNAIPIGNDQDITLDGSASSFCSNSYCISIQQCDVNGNPTGSEVSEWLNYISGSNPGPYYYSIGRFGIINFCQQNKVNLGCGNYYRIKLMAGDSVTMQVKIIYILPCKNVNSSFTVWANDVPPVHCSKPCPNDDCCTGTETITLYAPNSISCNRSFFLSIQQCDYFLNPVGNIAAGWLSWNDIINLTTNGTLDLHTFAKDTTHNGGIRFKADGTYLIKLLAGSGNCNEDSRNEYSTIIYLGKGTAINATDPPFNGIFIYPNPSNDLIVVLIPNNGSPVTIKVLDLQGRILKSIQTANEYQIIYISDLAPGIYLIEGVFSDKVLAGKMVKY
jgi:hypothetical protein